MALNHGVATMPSFPPLNTYLNTSVLLYPLIGYAFAWSLTCLLVGFLIGTHRGPVRLIFVPERKRFDALPEMQKLEH
jgi:hypothetical protein